MNRLILIFFLVLISTNDAFAYLDGGSASMFMQLILGGVAGFFAVIKLYWHKIVSFIKKGK